jgi:hypothetical protein
MFKIELDPVRVSTIQGLDAFGSIGPFAISQGEDLVVSGGSKGSNYPAKSCGVYEIHLPARDVSAAIETSDCRAGSPWRVLSLSPDQTEALISANRSLALLDLEGIYHENRGAAFEGIVLTRWQVDRRDTDQ